MVTIAVPRSWPALSDAGYEVIYTGLHQTPEMIAATAVQEAVDAVGLSIMSGAHMTLFPAVMAELTKRDAGDVIIFGGGIIPEDDEKSCVSTACEPSSSPVHPRTRSSISSRRWCVRTPKPAACPSATPVSPSPLFRGDHNLRDSPKQRPVMLDFELSEDLRVLQRPCANLPLRKWRRTAIAGTKKSASRTS